MPPLDPCRPAHGLKFRFHEGTGLPWAWAGDHPPEPGVGEEGLPELIDWFENDREGDVSLWIAADDPALTEDFWLCAGSCRGQDGVTKEELRELVLRRMREARLGPLPHRFSPQAAARLAVYLGASVEEMEGRWWAAIADQQKFVITDLLWRREHVPLLGPVLNRNLDLPALESARREQEALYEEDSPEPRGDLTRARLWWGVPIDLGQPWITADRRAHGSYGSRTGG